MSTFQPVSRGEAGVHALLADRERELVVGNDHRRFLQVVVEVHRARAGDSALATNRAGSGFHGMMSIFSAQLGHDHADSDPRGPTQAPTGSTPCACDSTAIFER